MKLFSDFAKLVGTRRRAVPLLVDNGRVWCPNHGDISVDQCVGCPQLVAYDGRELSCRDDRPWWFTEST